MDHYWYSQELRYSGNIRYSFAHFLSIQYSFMGEKNGSFWSFTLQVHIKSLTIGQREGVLKRGLGERAEAVRKVGSHNPSLSLLSHELCVPGCGEDQ